MIEWKPEALAAVYDELLGRSLTDAAIRNALDAAVEAQLGEKEEAAQFYEDCSPSCDVAAAIRALAKEPR